MRRRLLISIYRVIRYQSEKKLFQWDFDNWQNSLCWDHSNKYFGVVDLLSYFSQNFRVISFCFNSLGKRLQAKPLTLTKARQKMTTRAHAIVCNVALANRCGRTVPNLLPSCYTVDNDWLLQFPFFTMWVLQALDFFCRNSKLLWHITKTQIILHNTAKHKPLTVCILHSFDIYIILPTESKTLRLRLILQDTRYMAKRSDGNNYLPR